MMSENYKLGVFYGTTPETIMLAEKFVGNLINTEEFCKACEDLEMSVKCDKCREHLTSYAGSIFFYEKIGENIPDFVEDPEFESAKNEQSFVEGRIREVEVILADAQIISKKRKTNGHVEIGSTVIIKEGRYKPEEYLIVGAAEANPINGKISFESPLGSALMGKKTGEKVEVSAPSGSFTVKVVEVK